MLRTGRILYCSECGLPLGVLFDDSKEYHIRALCHYCARSEIIVRMACNMEESYVYHDIIGQVFHRDRLYDKILQAQTCHSNVIKHFLQDKLFPENFDPFPKMIVGSAQKDLDNLADYSTVVISSESGK